MPVVHEAAGVDVYGCTDGHKDGDEAVHWRRGVLTMHGSNVFVCVRGRRGFEFERDENPCLWNVVHAMAAVCVGLVE